MLYQYVNSLCGCTHSTVSKYGDLFLLTGLNLLNQTLNNEEGYAGFTIL